MIPISTSGFMSIFGCSNFSEAASRNLSLQQLLQALPAGRRPASSSIAPDSSVAVTSLERLPS